MSVAVQLAPICRCETPLVEDDDCVWCGKPIKTPEPYMPEMPDYDERVRRARSREYSRKARARRTPEQIARAHAAERERKHRMRGTMKRCVSEQGAYGKHDFCGGLSDTCVRCGAANTSKRAR